LVEYQEEFCYEQIEASFREWLLDRINSPLVWILAVVTEDWYVWITINDYFPSQLPIKAEILTPVEACDEFRLTVPLCRCPHLLVTKFFEHAEMLDLKLWHCGYDCTHEAVRLRHRTRAQTGPLKRPSREPLQAMCMTTVCIGKKSDIAFMSMI
jgi:hypothetical protein